MDQVGIGLLGPAPRRRIDLVGKDADGDREGDALGGEEGQLAFPVQTRRRDRRVRQPVERDVVEDVVSRQALGLAVGEDARDQVVAARVVVEHPGGQADRRIRERVERLRPVAPSPGRSPGRACRRSRAGPTRAAPRPRGRPARACRDAAPAESVGDGGRHVGVDAEQSRRRLQRHLLGDGIPPVAALGHVAGVAEALHQHDPGARDADRDPSRSSVGFAEKP